MKKYIYGFVLLFILVAIKTNSQPYGRYSQPSEPVKNLNPSPGKYKEASEFTDTEKWF